MAPQYKLTYFNVRGRGEIIRLVFVAAGVEYVDERIEGETWNAMKPSTPFGQLPVLTADGVVLCQSNSIARYLARKFNLAGKSDLESAQIDMIVDCVEDAHAPARGFFFEKDEARREELRKKFVEEQLPAAMANLENMLKSNNGGDGYFVGSELTWADLKIFFFHDQIGSDKFIEKCGKGLELFEPYPKLKAHTERIASIPNIAAWIAKRPVTYF